MPQIIGNIMKRVSRTKPSSGHTFKNYFAPSYSSELSRCVAPVPHETGPLLATLRVRSRRLVGAALVDLRVLRVYMSRSYCLAQDEAHESTDVPDYLRGGVRYSTMSFARRGLHKPRGSEADDGVAGASIPASLVCQGLAPRHLLRGESTAARGESGGGKTMGGHADVAENDEEFVTGRRKATATRARGTRSCRREA